MNDLINQLGNAGFLMILKALVNDDDVRHAIASVQHDTWSSWTQYVIESSDINDDGDLIIPSDIVDGWQRQIKTKYIDLTEKEKQVGLEQADKVLAIFDPASYSNQRQKTIHLDPAPAALLEADRA